MPRIAVPVREALPTDAEPLVALWRDHADAKSRPSWPEPAGAARALANLTRDPDQELLLALADEQPIGVAHLVRAPLSPLHEEMVVRVAHLFVAPPHRRRGVARVLLAHAVAWAEERQATHLLSSVPTRSRDANRFLARLGLAPVATLRAVPVPVLRDRLAKADAPQSADRPVTAERRRIVLRRQASARAARTPVRRG